jgi:hypothetical protein
MMTGMAVMQWSAQFSGASKFFVIFMLGKRGLVMKKELLIVVFLTIAQLWNQGISSASDRIALVIGNQNYKNDALTNPINDANALSEALRQVGFDVIKKTNLNKSDMLESFRDFGDKIIQNKATVALFYYSGHATQIDGINYLMPVSFDFDRIKYEAEAKEGSVNAEIPLEIIEEVGGKFKIMILDACRDNRFKKSRSAGGNGLAAMKSRGSLIAFSTSPGKTANDLGVGNSIYTKSLIKNLKKIGEPISSIFEDVAADVAEESKETQEPWYLSSLRGRFYFIPPNNTPNADQSPQNPGPQGGRTIGQYIDHGNGTITDTKTGLMWKRCSEGLSGVNCENGETGKYTWDDAVSPFKNLAYAGYSDWRLPTIDELKTLLYCSNGVNNRGNCNDGSERPTVNQQAFPNTKATFFWSGSPYAGDSDYAWYVNFGSGGSYTYYRFDNHAVRLVRGGQ